MNAHREQPALLKLPTVALRVTIRVPEARRLVVVDAVDLAGSPVLDQCAVGGALVTAVVRAVLCWLHANA